MSHRYNFWSLVLLFSGCATFLQRSEFQSGLEFYKKGEFREAAKYFSTYYNQHRMSDTTLYYLYDCYKKMNQPERELQVLQQLVKIGSEDENVYLNLFSYYRKKPHYKKLYELLIGLKSPVKDRLDKQYILTRRLYAEVVCGAFRAGVQNQDPMVFAISQGYFPVFPDGKIYENDTITQGNLIILLDRFVEPIYPPKFFKMENISTHSFFYLPYMRLIDFGILDFNPNLDPTDYATISMATDALVNLKKKGFIEIQ